MRTRTVEKGEQMGTYIYLGIVNLERMHILIVFLNLITLYTNDTRE